MEARAVAAGRAPARALVFIGFMGAGKTSAARAAAAAMGGRAVDSDHVVEQRIGTSIEAYFASHGERAFREQEEDAVVELLEAPPGPVLSLGGGAITSERVRSALADHTVVLLDVDVETAWHRAGGRRPLARDKDRFAALHAERIPVYHGLADVILLDSARERVRHAVPAMRALADAPAGTRLLWATSASAEYPVYVGDGLLGMGFWPADGRRFLVTDEVVGALYADRARRRGRRRAGRAGGDGQDARRGRARPARAGPRGPRPRRPRGRARRRRGRRPRRLLRGGLPARRRRRAGPDLAGRPGRLRLRRQDRRRPPRGQELRRRLPPARRRARRPGGAADPARRRARGRCGRGDQDGADRGRAAVAADPHRRACWPRRTAISWSSARAPSSRSSPRTSATAAAARCSTSATRSATRSRPPRATPATATARRSGSACWRR